MRRQLATRHQTFLWFTAIGALSGAVYFVALFFLIEALAVDYRLAVSISYGLAVLCHFGANRQITLRGREGSVYLHMMRYSVMIGLNYLTTMAIVIAMVSFMRISAYTAAAVAIAFNLTFNYSLSKHWIFRN